LFYILNIRKAKELIGLDDHVGPNLGLRAWQAISGAITIISIPLCLTKVEQGYYYAFASLLSAQVLFELGMGQVILYSISHEFSRIQSSANQECSTEIAKFARFSAILVLISKWYRNAAGLFAIVVGLFGLWFLGKKTELPDSDWIGPWIISVIFTSINLYCGALFSSLEGMGQISLISITRLKQSAVGHLIMWLLLYCGLGLWAFLAVTAVSAIHSVVFLSQSVLLQKHLYSNLFKNNKVFKSQIVSEILSFQWRIAVSWISGYLVFNLMVPTVFTKFGAVQAGKIGLSMAVFSAALTVGMSWVNAKSSTFAVLVSRHDFGGLNRIFNKNFKLSIGFVVISCFVLIVLLFFTQKMGFAVASRFVDLSVAVKIAVLTVSNSIIFSAATYLRSHREEPMMLVSIISGVLSFIAIYFGSNVGVEISMSLYLGVNLLYTLPATLLIFTKYYNKNL
jgi:hypothetical protein